MASSSSLPASLGRCGSGRFSPVLAGSRRFSPVLAGSHHSAPPFEMFYLLPSAGRTAASAPSHRPTAPSSSRRSRYSEC
eukprot:105405-Pleurochrysis_carterae.AAC.2